LEYEKGSWIVKEPSGVFGPAQGCTEKPLGMFQIFSGALNSFAEHWRSSWNTTKRTYILMKAIWHLLRDALLD